MQPAKCCRDFSQRQNEPVVRNLPEVKPRTPLSSIDTPLQGASTSNIPTEGEGLGHLVSGVGGLRLAKMRLDALDGN
jgi:hypothetical protein